MTIQQISIFVENKKGRMAEITKLLSDAEIDIRALSVADSADFGILRLIVNKPEKAAQALRDAGVTVSLTDVIAVGFDDKPGAFSEVVGVLAETGIDIEYMYAFISRTEGKAYVIMRVGDPFSAADTLEKGGFMVLKGSDVYDM